MESQVSLPRDARSVVRPKTVHFLQVLQVILHRWTMFLEEEVSFVRAENSWSGVEGPRELGDMQPPGLEALGGGEGFRAGRSLRSAAFPLSYCSPLDPKQQGRRKKQVLCQTASSNLTSQTLLPCTPHAKDHFLPDL